MTNAREKLVMYACHSVRKWLIPSLWRKNLQGAFKDGEDFNAQKMFFWIEKTARTKPKPAAQWTVWVGLNIQYWRVRVEKQLEREMDWISLFFHLNAS